MCRYIAYTQVVVQGVVVEVWYRCVGTCVGTPTGERCEVHVVVHVGTARWERVVHVVYVPHGPYVYTYVVHLWAHSQVGAWENRVHFLLLNHHSR